ncbi:helix-turn-helix domain-containing protein [Streptomyces sp. NPDC001795]|uniref:helix-turn-helix domain-containing protein n=1 Tax=unclassified Streptomyces TaxID=2593676 RepID=UPI00333083C1
MPYADGTSGERIGQRIAEARKARGLTQLQLAQRIPCWKSLIAQVERGHKPATSSLTAGAARALGVRLEQLTMETRRSERCSRNTRRTARLVCRQGPDLGSYPGRGPFPCLGPAGDTASPTRCVRR